MSKLPFIEMAKSAGRLTYYNWQALLKLGLIPIAVILGITLLNALLELAVTSSIASGSPGSAVGLGFVSLLLGLVQMAAIAPLAVAVHRFAFDVSDGKMPALGVAVTKTEWVYLAYLIAFAIVAMILFALGGAILSALFGGLLTAGGFGTVVFQLILLVLLLPPVIYLLMRFSFVYPEIAIARLTDPLKSWRQTARDHVELWLLALVVAAPFVVAGIVLGIVAAGFAFIPVLGAIVGILLQVVGAAVYIAAVVVFTVAISLAYRHVVE